MIVTADNISEVPMRWQKAAKTLRDAMPSDVKVIFRDAILDTAIGWRVERGGQVFGEAICLSRYTADAIGEETYWGPDDPDDAYTTWGLQTRKIYGPPREVVWPETDLTDYARRVLAELPK